MLLVAIVGLSGCAAAPSAVGLDQTTTSEAGNQPAATQSATADAGATRANYQIDKTATSNQSALKHVELYVQRAELSATALTLRVAFRNTSDQGFSIIGGISGQDARLLAGGDQYKPTSVSTSLETAIDPEGGFAPGAAHLGDLVFPRPTGSGPFELYFPTFTTLRFSLDTPITATAAPLPAAVYAVGGAVRSTASALRQIELQVEQVELTDQQVLITVGFRNIGRQGFDLVVGPKGGDARLLDADGRPYTPTRVDRALATSIAPKGGWQPGQEYSGVLAFARPESPERLRFLFPNYDALSITLQPDGTATATVTSPTGGAPRPTPLPSPGEVALTAIDALLAQQANAVMQNDADGYTATFVDAQRDDQRDILRRVAALPLITYTLRLAPDASLPDGGAKTARLPVELTYALQGINSDNPFQHMLTIDFAAANGTWLVRSIDTGDAPPFWFADEVITQQTEHFLILARPESVGDLAGLEQETEQAYATLAARGLVLEPRYVAYFTADQNDFRTMTNSSGANVLGVALSRYTFLGDTIAVTNRAFYINGAAFTNTRQIPGTDRQTTITHELVHLALAADTRPYTPPWLSEGAAVYYSNDLGSERRQRLLRSDALGGLSLQALTSADGLGSHDALGEQTNNEYTFSGEAVAYIIETYGEAKLLNLYRSFGAVSAADVRARVSQSGGSFATNTDFAPLRTALTTTVVQEILGVSLDQLDADVKAWLNK